MPSGGGSLPTSFLRRSRTPTPSELFAELKGTAWTCASINASVSLAAAAPLRIDNGRPTAAALPKRSLDPNGEPLAAVRALLRPVAAPQIEEVLDHPLLALLRQVNPSINAFDLWELTQMSLDVQGSAYWLLDLDPILEQPQAIWVLPAQLVSPRAAIWPVRGSLTGTSIAARRCRRLRRTRSCTSDIPTPPIPTPPA